MLSGSFLHLSTLAISLLHTVQSAPLTFHLDKRSVNFDYNNDIVRGVNLGGWFVLEPWITPSIFEPWATSKTVVDEYTYTQTLGKDAASTALTNHWNTWITEDDFTEIAQNGLNHVRIPIGYWAVAPLDGDPYVQGQLDVLDQAVKWARNANLRILLDLHGAPQSQNGFDNSGRYGAIDWQQGDSVSQTITALQVLAQRYSADTDVVTAIELLNEPMGPALNIDEIRTFYQSGYETVTGASSSYVTVIHDAFEGFETYWNGFMTPASSGDQNVLLDTHQYQVFTPGQVAMSPSDHVSAACALGPQLAGTDKWTIVGEWTGAQTDCAQWLNGLGKGARYDGSLANSGSSWVGSCANKSTGTVAGLSSDDQSNLQHFIDAQLDAYEQHSGWIFWTWRTESAPEWHLQNLTAAGLFPNPPTSRAYPGQCNS